METKICTKCKVEKSSTEFCKCSRHKDGLSYFCKQCRNAYLKEYRTKNKEIIRAISRRYINNNREKHNAYKRNWSAKNQINISAKNREWRKNNRDKYNANRRRSKKRSVFELRNSYVAAKLSQSTGLPKAFFDARPELIEAKRQLMKIKREYLTKSN